MNLGMYFQELKKLKLLVLLILNIMKFFELIGVAVFMSFISIGTDERQWKIVICWHGYIR